MRRSLISAFCGVHLPCTTSTTWYTMRFSRPSTTSRLRSPMSASTSTTCLPRRASAVPRFAVVVVLPTPPFPDVMTMARPISFLLTLSRRSALVRLDDDATLGRVRDFGGALRVVAGVGRAGDQAPDANLLRIQAQRDDVAGIAAAGRMREAAQGTHDDDVAARAYFGARIDVTDDDEVRRRLDHRARTQG